jgi:hypothetical protein
MSQPNVIIFLLQICTFKYLSMHLSKEFMQFYINVVTNTQIHVHTKFIFLEKKLMQIIKSYFIN